MRIVSPKARWRTLTPQERASVLNLQKNTFSTECKQAHGIKHTFNTDLFRKTFRNDLYNLMSITAFLRNCSVYSAKRS